MNRSEFEAIRDLPGKVIRGDIHLVRKKSVGPARVAENIRIENASGLDLRLAIVYNPEVGSKTFNVHLGGRGPICRLDVDGPRHREAGRSHKHALATEHCPRQNLRKDVTECAELAGRSVEEVFKTFCTMAQMVHEGELLGLDAEGTEHPS